MKCEVGSVKEKLVIAAPASSIQSLPRSAFIRGAGMVLSRDPEVLLLIQKVKVLVVIAVWC